MDKPQWVFKYRILFIFCKVIFHNKNNVPRAKKGFLLLSISPISIHLGKPFFLIILVLPTIRTRNCLTVFFVCYEKFFLFVILCIGLPTNYELFLRTRKSLISILSVSPSDKSPAWKGKYFSVTPPKNWPKIFTLIWGKEKKVFFP